VRGARFEDPRADTLCAIEPQYDATPQHDELSCQSDLNTARFRAKMSALQPCGPRRRRLGRGVSSSVTINNQVQMIADPRYRSARCRAAASNYGVKQPIRLLSRTTSS